MSNPTARHAMSLPPRVRAARHALLVAAALFAVWIVPAVVLDPTAHRWLLSGDAAQHFLGWQFFRAEGWSWPPGRLQGYGLEMGSSIVYTDSIPLVALALKPFEALLPDTFQYAGLWIVACYVLAAGYAWRCGWLATGRATAAFACAAFAIASPILAMRAQGHFALMAHFLVWWSLGDYLATRPVPRASRLWCVAIAALVHAYLLVLVLAVVVADALRRTLVLREWTPRELALHAGQGALVLGATLFLAGYFVLGGSAGSEGMYGRYAAHLGSLWNPIGASPFLPSTGVDPVASMEASSYLGFGALSLVALALLAAAFNARARRCARYHWPLAAAAGVLALLALSHRVRYGAELVLEVPLAPALEAALSTFRASGRLLWLAYYALVATAVVACVRWLPARAAQSVLALALVLQVADLAGFYRGYRGHVATLVERQSRESPVLADAFWARAARHYDRVLVAPMEHQAPHWIELGEWASRHGLSINVGQFARASWPRFADAYARVLRELASGALAPDALYVVARPESIDVGRLHPDDAAGWVDGVYVVAPRWRRLERCCLETATVAVLR